MSKTNTQYTNVINVCRDIFSKKTKDYGTAWRILRPSSLNRSAFYKGVQNSYNSGNWGEPSW